jgi:hypothetical protein
LVLGGRIDRTEVHGLGRGSKEARYRISYNRKRQMELEGDMHTAVIDPLLGFHKYV